MTSVLDAYLVTGAVVLGYMTLWYLAALLAGRNDIVDIAWGLGFVLVAVVMAWDAGWTPRSLLVLGLVSIWGVRLAVHIGTRARGASEDFRYATWRREWGRWFYVRTYLQVFLLQGLFMVLVASPVVVVGAAPPSGLGPLDLIGALVALAGVAFEAVADAQLRRFKADPTAKGRILDTGLWSWSRHPNYFGDSVAWFGVAFVALSVPFGAVGMVGPVTITLLLRFVSGVPMLERKRAGDPAWEAYASRTSAFVPLPPRSTPPG